MRLPIFAALLAVGVPAFAGKPLPRPAEEFKIVEPSGKTTLLSSFKGKVVVLEFLFTSCDHCQMTSQTMTKLQQELGPRGFQALGVMFDVKPAGGTRAELTKQFVEKYSVGYPVGYTTNEAGAGYLGYAVGSRYLVPQMVIIDRKGTIRIQTPMDGEDKYTDEKYLRKIIESMLSETATPEPPKKASVASKKSS